MGKLNYIDEIEGYSFISDKGYRYDLLEGYTFQGNATSDIIFVLLSFDEELSERVERDEFVGYFYGASLVLEYKEDYIKTLDYLVNEYEKKKNL